jgi:hypothetical protein
MTDQEAQDLVDERAKELRTVLHCSCGKVARSFMDWRSCDGCCVEGAILLHFLLDDCDGERP